MKKFVIALTALGALMASPAIARDSTHISFGFYAPAPIYYEPVVYHPPVRQVYYAPAYRPCHKRHHRGHGWGHERRFESAWNEPRGGYGHGRGGHH